MKATATFSWTAPGELFFLKPPSGTPEEICQKIKADAARTLQDHPSLEGLESYYNLSGATSFEAEGRCHPLHDWGEDVQGPGRYELIVSIRGEINCPWKYLATYNLCEMWDELEESGMAGDPEAFRIEVRYVG